MREVTEKEVKNRLAFDNPWWSEQGAIDPEIREWPKRAYFDAFLKLVTAKGVRRAVVLMGPRRVGKTVMIQQTVQHLIDHGTAPRSVLYVSLDTPTYIGLPLEHLLQLFQEHHGHQRKSELCVFFDEIQYLKDWEIHLKSLVDSYPGVRFVASGSAAAALRLKSRESGAGRFTDFLLPPLTFAEYLRFANLEDELILPTETPCGWVPYYTTTNIGRLNEAFVDYLNFGGYPEAVISESVRRESARYIRSDIIDKVLLRDLPSLYGISDVQELNSLFTTLAYNSASEVGYEGLSQSSGIAKNTLRRYLEYLEAAFLIQRVRRLDRRARRFKRETAFKVYLTNTSMRAALFGPVTADDEAMGSLAETAIFAQWMHAIVSFPNVYYARWPKGEVDLVHVRPDQRGLFGATEVKWSDRYFRHPDELRGLIEFALENNLGEGVGATTRTETGENVVRGVKIVQEPCALACYRIGRGAIEHRRIFDELGLRLESGVSAS